MTLEFRMREHYGRQDFYPENEAARVALEFKKRVASGPVKCLKREELELLKKLGHEIRIITKFEEAI